MGANAVVGIQTTVLPFQGVHEMMMMGLTAHNPALPTGRAPKALPPTSAGEMWNHSMGYAPVKLVLGTAVYSLGVVGGVMAALKSFARGEISELTTLIYDAREHHHRPHPGRGGGGAGADDVVGIKTCMRRLGKLLEFMASRHRRQKNPGHQNPVRRPAAPGDHCGQGRRISDDRLLFQTTG